MSNELHNSLTGRDLEWSRQRLQGKKNVEKWCLYVIFGTAWNGKNTYRRAKLHWYKIISPFQCIFLDILSPLPKTSVDNKYILVVMDYLKKRSNSYSMPDKEISTTAEYEWNNRCRDLETFIDSFQPRMELYLCCIQRIMSSSQDWKKKKNTQTTPLHLKSAGMVERFNWTILKTYYLKV